MSNPTRDSFLNDVSNHQMHINFCNGGMRNIRFQKPNSSCQYFDITTWPGHLCISGDMGCYVFQRLPDMFEFFRSSELKINPGYWDEKIQALSRFGNGVRKWDEALAEAYITREFDEFMSEYDGDKDDLEDLNHSFNSLKEAAHDQCEFSQEISCWDHNDLIDFSEWWDYDFESHTYHFIWCCYAIVWAIQQFDAHIEALEAA